MLARLRIDSRRWLGGLCALPGDRASGRLALALAAVALGYGLLKLGGLVNVSVGFHGDTPDYTLAAQYALWDPRFFAGVRPITVPLVYKLFGNNGEAITVFQWLLSLVCWAVLAVFVARAVRTPWLKPVALALTLTFSLTAPISQWDRILLSESISLSLLALLLASWLWLLEGWAWRKLLAVLAVAFFWAWARETNAYALLMVAGLVGLVMLLKRPQWRYLVLAAGFVALFLATDLSASAGQRWVRPFEDVLAQRVLTSPERTAFFVQRGMPLTPALQRLAGGYAHDAGHPFDNDPELADFRAWLAAHGKQTYLQFLLSHPDIALQEPVNGFFLFLTPGLPSYRPTGFAPPLGEWLNEVLYPTDAAILGLWMVAMLGLAVAVSFRREAPVAWIVPISLLLLTYPSVAVVWHGDAIEYGRHGLQVSVQFRLGVWLLLPLALDRLIWPRIRRATVAPTKALPDEPVGEPAPAAQPVGS